ncbi:MAG: hypothetical protein ACLTW9_20170 [Enterocloster sp.]
MPDGIVAASDATANGIARWPAGKMESGIPEDFSLIGFDNMIRGIALHRAKGQQCRCAAMRNRWRPP